MKKKILLALSILNSIVFYSSAQSWSSPTSSGSYLTNAMAMDGSNNLYAAGNFTSLGGAVNHIAKWNGSAWVAVGTGTTGNGSGTSSTINDMIYFNNNIIVGGGFSDAGGVSVNNNIASWNGSAWSAMGSGGPTYIYQFQVFNGQLYVAASNGVFFWAGTAWQQLGNFQSAICLGVHNNNLFVSGIDVNVGLCIAKWNGSQWISIGTLGGAGTNLCYALESYNGSLYAGGGFTTINGLTMNGFAKWNGTSWNMLSNGIYNPGNNWLTDFTVYNNLLYIGGAYSGGGVFQNLSWWNSVTGNWDLPVVSFSALGATDFLKNNNDLYICGVTGIDGVVINNIAKYTPEPVTSNLNVGILNTSVHCGGAAISVPFTATGTFNPGNIFTAQLSNAIGNFSTPVNIGTLSGTGSGTISATLPATINTYSAGYRIRVISSIPAINGKPGVDNLELHALPAATISMNGTGGICPGSFLTLTATNGPGYTFQWKKNGNIIPSAVFQTYQATTAGSYTCTVSNPCGSANSNALALYIITANIISAGSTDICSNSMVDLGLYPTIGNTYTWYGNGLIIASGTGLSAYPVTCSPFGPTDYYVVVNDVCNGIASNVITVNCLNLPQPVISHSRPLDFCTGDSTVLSVPSTGSYYTWWYFGPGGLTIALSGANANALTVYTSGTFYCEESDSCGNLVNTSTVVVHASPGLPTGIFYSQGPTTFCQGGQVVLGVTSTNASSFQWNKNSVPIPGAIQISYAATSSGNYTVTLTNPCGSSAIGSSNVTVNSLPSAVITPAGPTTFCNGSTVLLNASTGVNRSYQWRKNGVNIGGAISPSYTATTTGTYKVTVTNTSTGCTKISPAGIAVTVNSNPPATATPQGPTTFCAGDSVLLKANYSASYSYQWKKNNANIAAAITHKYEAKTAGSYKVKVTNANGCSQVSSLVTVSVPCREALTHSEINTDFSVNVYPNPSEEDFVFEIQGVGADKNMRLEIFDLSGRLIQSQDILQLHFTMDARSLPAGIYFATVSNAEQQEMIKLIKTR